MGTGKLRWKAETMELPGWKGNEQMDHGADLKAVQEVLAAAWFAAQKHAGQRRKGAAAEPYINHLIEVAQLVSSALWEPDTGLILAALLHDTIEDTSVTKEELAQRFGPDV